VSGIERDDLDKCWCCDGLHDSLGCLCPDCDEAGCQHFGGVCRSDHKPVVPDGGNAANGTERDGVVRTDIGTTVVVTPKRVQNPVTERTEDLTNLSADGYCRRFLALLAATNTPDHVDVGSSPVLTFDKSRWELRETDGQHVLVKREAETKFDGKVLGNDRSVQPDTGRSGGGSDQ